MYRSTFLLLHLFLIITVFTSLFSGLRIATVTHDSFLLLSPMLPEGRVHFWHMLSACTLTILSFSYLIYKNKNKSPPKGSKYHIFINHFGYLVFVTSLITGWCVYFNLTQFNTHTIHLISALLIIAYLILHSWIYVIQYGKKLIKMLLFIPKRQFPWACLLALLLVTPLFFYLTLHNQTSLQVTSLKPQTLMEVDGLDTEVAWQNTPSIKIHTIGGANFVDGQTTVTIKAVHNQHETFFLFKWQDPTHSLAHLPLEKTQDGWKVKENGFVNFDERKHYEDKFAVMLSHTCGNGADGTTHLGKKPLDNKPSNWHGKGYHASVDGNIRDLWHWKAVRTNDMVLADDNFIGPPAQPLHGQRRYSAGYLPDGKESGAYVMNWQWYSKKGVVPKRLPNALTTQYQVLPWFGSSAYQSAKDNYPIGSQIPSVLYRSNRFEGDRADVRARGHWKNGVWTLELVRKNQTNSDHDVALQNGVCMWVSAFDHSQIAHTRHNAAIALRYSL